MNTQSIVTLLYLCISLPLVATGCATGERIAKVVESNPDVLPSPRPGLKTDGGQSSTSRSGPDEATYAIIDSHVVPGVKRSLTIRLSRKVPAATLRSIAVTLRNKDPKTYQRTFIGYYLPGMPVGAGAWATTHFNPDLEVRVFGMTVEHEAELSQEPSHSSRQVGGRWIDERVGASIVLWGEGERLFMQRQFKDGSSVKKEMVAKASRRGKRYEEKGGSSFGDHLVVSRAGDLEIRDGEGLIAVARRLD